MKEWKRYWIKKQICKRGEPLKKRQRLEECKEADRETDEEGESSVRPQKEEAFKEEE